MAKETYNNKFVEWVDTRLPVFTFFRHALKEYPTPKNLNFLWNTGSLAGITLMIMIITGITLAMHYCPDPDNAFQSVERIMRDVNYGWLIRYIHMNGASFFFILVYIHIFRGMYYGSYKTPRELLWILGVVIFLMMMATAFMGYVLPWGQMSFWGAKVITNLFSAIPLVGDTIVHWLLGGPTVGAPTLSRFFALHYLLPFGIVGIVCLHMVALHQFGSNNPLGIDPKHPSEQIPFHPYYTVKDLLGLGIYLLIFSAVVFFMPNLFGEAENYNPANSMVTPLHIVPEWYFLPFYAILRSIPSKLGGVIAMFGAVFVLFLLPWLDRSKVRSATFRPLYRPLFWVFVFNSIVLGWIGGKPPEGIYLIIGRCATAYYFFHFCLLLPLLSVIEKPSPVPESITAYLHQKKRKG
jgi:quinol-cytochrome oxidoreductase complex cytochrome b subunit